MGLSKKSEEVLESISQMSVMDVVELVKAMEDKFGVSAAAAVAQAPASAVAESADSAEAEQTSFDVVLANVGDKKINVIKAVRSITGLGLKEAKGLVDEVVGGTPKPVKEGAGKEEAEEIQKQLEEAGATSELK